MTRFRMVSASDDVIELSVVPMTDGGGWDLSIEPTQATSDPGRSTMLEAEQVRKLAQGLWAAVDGACDGA